MVLLQLIFVCFRKKLAFYALNFDLNTWMNWFGFDNFVFPFASIFFKDFFLSQNDYYKKQKNDQKNFAFFFFCVENNSFFSSSECVFFISFLNLYTFISMIREKMKRIMCENKWNECIGLFLSLFLVKIKLVKEFQKKHLRNGILPALL